MSLTNHILIVEDDPDQRALFAQMLEMRGYQVVVAPDGETALARLSDREFDLLLSDWYLPGINGNTLISEVKKRQKTLKAILMSNHYNVQEAAQASGADGYICKGDLRHLLEVVANILTA